jgi:hypothetical protein
MGSKGFVKVFTVWTSLRDQLYACFSTETVKVDNFTGLTTFTVAARVTLNRFSSISSKKKFLFLTSYQKKLAKGQRRHMPAMRRSGEARRQARADGGGGGAGSDLGWRVGESHAWLDGLLSKMVAWASMPIA